MEKKKVRLKISRKKLESMTKEEVFQFIEDEKAKHAEARKEAKRKRAKERSWIKEGQSSWAVMVPLGLGIGVVIFLVTYILMAIFTDEYVVQPLQPTEFHVPAGFEHLGIFSERVFLDTRSHWNKGDFDQVPAGIDAIIDEMPDEQKLHEHFTLKKLEAYTHNQQYDIAISYAQTLQTRFGSDSEHMNEIIWFRAYSYYQTERYYEAFRHYQRVSQMPGERAEEAWRIALHINEDIL